MVSRERCRPSRDNFKKKKCNSNQQEETCHKDKDVRENGAYLSEGVGFISLVGYEQVPMPDPSRKL